MAQLSLASDSMAQVSPARPQITLLVQLASRLQ